MAQKTTVRRTSRTEKSRNSRSDHSSAPLVIKVIGAVAAITVISAWGILSAKNSSLISAPDMELRVYRDISSSFSGWNEVQPTLASIFNALGNKPTAVVFSAVGGSLERVGSTVVTTKKQYEKAVSGWPDPDPSASNLEVCIDDAATEATARPNVKIVAELVTDGQATNFLKLEKSVNSLAKCPNACLIIVGVIPSARISVDKACRSLGGRYLSVSVHDANVNLSARVSRVASLAEVRHAR